MLHLAFLQPVNGVVFALDGVLIGAGDMRFLAVAMVGAAVVFVPLAPVGVGRRRGHWLALGRHVGSYGRPPGRPAGPLRQPPLARRRRRPLSASPRCGL